MWKEWLSHNTTNTSYNGGGSLSYLSSLQGRISFADFLRFGLKPLKRNKKDQNWPENLLWKKVRRSNLWLSLLVARRNYLMLSKHSVSPNCFPYLALSIVNSFHTPPWNNERFSGLTYKILYTQQAYVSTKKLTCGVHTSLQFVNFCNAF